MKRYTSFTDDYPVVRSDHCWEDQNENYCGPAIERLAEYEATGLMPAEVAALQYQLRHAIGVQRWIPVTERLPEIECCTYSVDVLFYVRNDGIYAGYVNHETGTWKCRCHAVKFAKNKVTHWMPLPPAPKEVE